MQKRSHSLLLAEQYLGTEVSIIIDRPLGSKHSKHGFLYEVNYGYVSRTRSADGEELDAYYLGVSRPLHTAQGNVLPLFTD